MAIEQHKSFFGNVVNEYWNADERSHDLPTS